MKTRTLKTRSLAFMTLFVAASAMISCQEENDVTATEANGEELTITYLAENFDKELSDEKVDAIVKAYRALSYEEMTEFIDAQHAVKLAEGISKERADLALALQHEINAKVNEQTGLSSASADQDLVVSIFEQLTQKEKYQSLRSSTTTSGDAGRVQAACSPWYFTKSIEWVQFAGDRIVWPFYFVGSYNFGGASDDCDYVFYSKLYNKYYKAYKLQGITAQSRAVLGWNGGTTLPAAEPLVNSKEAILEFGAGKGRVDFQYTYSNAPTRFSDHVKVLLVKR